jgi:ATP-dependent RNA helicase DDX55/SPB4
MGGGGGGHDVRPTEQREAEGPRFTALVPSLRPESLSVLASQGFERATPVQAAAINLLAGNKDVSVEACTGSGKTLAFVLPMIEILARAETPFRKHQVGAVVVSPTRELARQIHDVVVPFLATVPGLAPPALLVGGTDASIDARTFAERGAVTLIGTPGRLDDIMTRSKAMDVKKCELLILDEADRLLSMGFVKTLNAIIARLPKQRRTGLFSATQTEELEELARAGLRNPVRVTVRDAASQAAAAAAAKAGTPQTSAVARGKLPAQLKLMYDICPVDERLYKLCLFLREHVGAKTIVYFLTCACVDYFATALARGAPADPGDGVVVVALHGKMKQAQREAALSRFADTDGGCLLCTDVAARGLDIPGVDWVVQFDAPQDPAAFVHRVGRTARMGREGSALVYLAPHESSYVEFLKVRHIDVKELRVNIGGVGKSLKGAGGTMDSKVGNCNDVAAGQCQIEGEENSEDERWDEEKDVDDFNSCDDPVASRSMTSSDASGAAVLCDALRARSEKNREAMEKGTRAFVSYIRGYKEHHCRFIFRHKELELAKLARAMGLLRLPRMKEIRKAPKSTLRGFVESSANPDDVPYADRAREKQRVRALVEQRAARESHPEAFVIVSKREKEKQRREEALVTTERTKSEKRLTAAKRRQQEAREDFDDINDDYRALKKLKKGKLSEEEFAFELGIENSDGVTVRQGAFSAVSTSHRRGQTTGQLYGAALRAAEKKPRPAKPRHLKNSKAKGGGRGAKAMKKKGKQKR